MEKIAEVLVAKLDSLKKPDSLVAFIRVMPYLLKGISTQGSNPWCS